MQNKFIICMSYHQKFWHVLNSSFYRMFWLNRNIWRGGAGGEGGVILYINKRIWCKILNYHTKSILSEVIIIEFLQSKRKWLMLGIYKPLIQDETDFLQQLSSLLAFYYPRYENIMVIEDFNVTVENHHPGLTTKPTCHQSKIATCFDLILIRKIVINLW